MTRPYKKKNRARSSSKKKDKKQEYTDEQIHQMVKEILNCNYFPQDITQSDMEDYLRKEESGEAVFTSLESVERAQKAIELKRNELIDEDRKSTRLNSSHANISYAVFCLKKKK